MSNKKPLSKRTIYTIFLAKFAFSLALIFWTIKMTLGAGVGLDDDNTFMSTYHHVDDNYNEIVLNNNKFEKLYSAHLTINGKDIGQLTYDDIYLSQRVIKKRKDRKDILKVGQNNISMIVIDKKTSKVITDYKTSVIYTTTVNHKNDLTIELKSGINNFEISKKSYWNIMGKIEVANDIGHFYIKTNSK